MQWLREERSWKMVYMLQQIPNHMIRGAGNIILWTFDEKFDEF